MTDVIRVKKGGGGKSFAANGILQRVVVTGKLNNCVKKC